LGNQGIQTLFAEASPVDDLFGNRSQFTSTSRIQNVSSEPPIRQVTSPKIAPTSTQVIQRVSSPTDQTESKARTPGKPVDRKSEPGLGSIPGEQAQVIFPRNPTAPIVAAPEPSEASRTGRPVAEIGVSRPSKEGSVQMAPPGVAGSVFGPSKVAGGQKSKKEGADSTTMGRIAAAPSSPLKTQALIQGQLIIVDGLNSEAQVSRIAIARRQQISGQFSGIRQGLSSFFIQSIKNIQALVTAKHAEISKAAAVVLRSIQAFIASALLAVEAQSNQIRGAINGVIDSATAALQERVLSIAGQIAGVINAVPLPDLPGVTGLRGMAVSLLGQASGLVTRAAGQVLGFIRSAANVGMGLLGSMLDAFGQVVNGALSLVASTIEHIIQLVFDSLERVMNLMVSTLEKVEHYVIFPLLDRLEAFITQAITHAEQQALGDLRANREKYLEALATSVAPEGGSDDNGAKAASVEDSIAAIHKLGEDAIHNNRTIVQTFTALTSLRLTMMFQALATAAGKIIQQIVTGIAQAVQKVMNVVSQVIQGLARLVQAVTSVVQSLIQDIAAKLTSLVQYVRLLVQSPIDQLITFALNALSRVRDFVGRLVQNFISGGGSIASSVTQLVGEFSLTNSSLTTASRGPITKPSPGTVIGIILAGLGAIITFIAAAIVAFLGAPIVIIIGGWTITTTVGFLVLVALVVLLLVIILIYLLSKPKPKPPKKPMCNINTKTLLSAPDGTPDTRKTVGVKERVEMTSSSTATWSAMHGTITPTSGTKVIWTAPATGVITTVKAILVTGKQCLRLMTVKAPTSLSMIKNREHALTPGTAGACMITDVTIHPRNVCLGATQWRL
jgi:hypothetical protein